MQHDVINGEREEELAGNQWIVGIRSARAATEKLATYQVEKMVVLAVMRWQY